MLKKIVKKRSFRFLVSHGQIWPDWESALQMLNPGEVLAGRAQYYPTADYEEIGDDTDFLMVQTQTNMDLVAVSGPTYHY